MFERITRFIAEKCARALSPYMEAELQAYRGEIGTAGGGWSTGGSFSERTALGVASFHSAVKLISELAASLELQVQERVPGTDRWQAVIDHDLEWRLNNAPNSLQTGSAFQRLRYVHQLTHGRTFTVIRWQNGAPAALWPIHPGSFTPIDDEIRGRTYQVQFGNRTETLDQSEGIDVLGMTLDGITALSPIRQFASNLDLSKGTRDQASAFYHNQPKPGFILKIKRKLGDVEFAKLKKQLDESYRLTNAGRSMLMDGVGDGFDFEQFQPMTFADYQLLELMAQNDKDIGSKIFNLPPEELKGYERVEHLEKYVLGPFLLHDAQALSRQLPATADLRRIRIRHNLRGLVDMDIKTRYESYRVGIMSGFIKINEVRGLLNLEPDPKGDELYLPQSVYGKPGTQPVVNPMKGSRESGVGSREPDPASAAAAEARTAEQGSLPLDVNPQYHGLLTDVLASLFTREQHFIQRAATKPQEWRSEVESWYGKHEATVREKLRHMPEERSRLILSVVAQHRGALLDLAHTADLPSSAARISEHWPAEAAALALTLLES